MTSQRRVISIQPGQPASDGAGVRLNRVIGGPGLERFDPFLMLDEFPPDNPDDYIAGFPPHPHRGFETITYMLEGRMRHEDHLGNVGLLGELVGQQLRNAIGEVDAELCHHLDDLGVHALGRCRPGREGEVAAAGRALEQRRAHLRAPGVVQADEQRRAVPDRRNRGAELGGLVAPRGERPGEEA